MEFTPEHISKVLAEIQSRIPKNLLANVVRETKAVPIIEKIVDLALADPDFPQVKKERLQVLKDSGQINKMKYKEDPRMARMIDNFLGREINKAVKAGRLPSKDKIGDLPHVIEMYERVLGKKL
jgi:hypothetical protein